LSGFCVLGTRDGQERARSLLQPYRIAQT
jgi:hypothetical protein